VKVLLHSIAFGNLKLIAPEKVEPSPGRRELAERLGVGLDELTHAVDELFGEGADALQSLASLPAYSARSFIDDEDLERTIFSMGTSLLGWVQSLLARDLFAGDARVFGLTSEGNEVAWKGYAAVAAAKVALESISRSMAVELAPRGIRSNVIQAGVTDTPALAAIPGSGHLKAAARQRNPFGRLTTPRDVANVIYLLCTPDAAWINGEVIRVDGGEHISGAIR
jgi:NAD(P)-dependent dehydrogenase (short-subunit alcohol dehydrogenase family)